MHKSLKKVFVVLLTAGMIIGSVYYPVEATEAKDQDNGVLEAQDQNDTGIASDHNTGYNDIPEEQNMPVPSFDDKVGRNFVNDGITIPESYSSATLNGTWFTTIFGSNFNNYVSLVKDQGYTENCWAYASNSVSESNSIKNGLADINSVDYDENHLAYFTYNRPIDSLGLTSGDYVDSVGVDWKYRGGNSLITMMMLAQWMGVYQEGFNPSSVTGSNAADLAYDNDEAHLENAYMITMPNMNGSYLNDMINIKTVIKTQGSGVLSYKYSNDHQYYNAEKGAYYSNTDDPNGNGSGGHAISVVGWDDNYSKNNFATVPANNGAWLCKNSRGQSFGIEGNTGYFWISYYDASLDNWIYSWDMGSEDNYDNNYQYDGSSGFASYCNISEIYGANAFTSDSNEILKAVGFYTFDINLNYTVNIYKGLSATGTPTSGTLASTKSGSCKYMGFHTINLDTDVNLNNGDRYAVVIRLSKTGNVVNMAYDVSNDWNWVKFVSKAMRYQSYKSLNGSTWEDINSGNISNQEGKSIRIKAYTDELPYVNVSYRSHLENIGWQDFVYNGTTSGTTGQGLRLEGINIKIESNMDLGITYKAHVQNIGWQSYVADGALAGTQGQSLRLEAIKIELTGSEAANYDIYYQVHVQDYGWLGWAMNGQASGTEGLGLRLEGINIVVAAKGIGSYNTANHFISGYGNGLLQYKTHVENIGWQGYVSDGVVSGTEGQSLRLEALQITSDADLPSGSVIYRTHVQDYGWLGWTADGGISGTVGESKRMEAVSIYLSGEISAQYDIYYRVHVQNYGWLGWTANGADAGTQGLSLRLEGIQIMLILKGDSSAPDSGNAFIM